jgi:hypothetical protein
MSRIVRNEGHQVMSGRNTFTNDDLALAADILAGWNGPGQRPHGGLAAIAVMLRDKAAKRKERAAVMREARARGCNPRFVRRPERGNGAAP